MVKVTLDIPDKIKRDFERILNKKLSHDEWTKIVQNTVNENLEKFKAILNR